MKITKEILWEDRRNDNVTYTSYLVEPSADIKNINPRPAVIICGGGGGARVTERDKTPVALYFLDKGFQAITLDYTVGAESAYPKPIFDLAKMLLVTKEHADEWNIDSDKIVLVGFSAGATLCASLATRWHESFLQESLGCSAEDLKPALAILSYPLVDFHYQYKALLVDPDKHLQTSFLPISKEEFLTSSLKTMIGQELTEEKLRKNSPIEYISNQTVPTFIWGMQNDDVIYSNQLLDYAKRLRKHHILFECHLFATGQHALSVINRNSQANFSDYQNLAIWRKLAIRFINQVLKLD
ncbi:alpha/beta hydrolase [Streptococcus dentiloxodontae]